MLGIGNGKYMCVFGQRWLHNNPITDLAPHLIALYQWGRMNQNVGDPNLPYTDARVRDFSFKNEWKDFPQIIDI